MSPRNTGRGSRVAPDSTSFAERGPARGAGCADGRCAVSGFVEVLHDHPDEFVVACFNTDCPEHGDGTFAAPWVDEFTTRREAEKAARDHRQMIRDHWLPECCPACGQRVRSRANSGP